MSEHHSSHHNHEHHGSELSEVELRVRALESVLVEKHYVDRAALDEIVEFYEKTVGPRNGARVVAKAWSDPTFHQRLMTNATAAIAEFGFTGRQSEHIVAVENTANAHNLIVCTLCSCYPWAVLGLPPTWYKSAHYRSTAVMDPRGLLASFGVNIAEATRIHVWDSTAEVRYLVIPRRPAGTDGWSEERLARLVTRNSMVGAGLPLDPRELRP
ncbi:nitrile hydratase subunit alpha [Bradyrhizobium manausense]